MVKTKKTNIPELRFPGFEEEWVEITLKKIITEFIVPMRDKPKVLTGDIPWCRIEDLNGKNLYGSKSNQGVSSATVKSMNLKVYPVNTLLVSCSANLGFCAITKKELITNQTFIGLVPNINKVNVDFLYYLMGLSNKKLNTLSSGTTISYLSRVQFEEFRLKISTLNEQEKIASFLSAVDERIQHLSKKKSLLEQYKKGVMQQIFSQKLRFKDDKGNNFPDWVAKKIGEIAIKKSSQISANGIEENCGEFIIYGASGILKKIDFYEEEEDYVSIVKDGAGVGRLLYCKGKSSVLGTMDIIKPISQKINTFFLYYILNNIDFIKYITGSTIPHIYFKDYSNENCKVPSLPEQEKIASFLASIDNKIKLVNTQLEKTKTWKKGLLQKMFV